MSTTRKVVVGYPWRVISTECSTIGVLFVPKIPQVYHHTVAIIGWSESNGVSLLRVFDTAGYGRIRQDTAGYGRIRQDTAGYGRIRQDTTGYGRIRQDTAGYGRIRQDTAGYGRYGRIRQDTTGFKISACLHYENNHFAFIKHSVVFHTVLACLL